MSEATSAEYFVRSPVLTLRRPSFLSVNIFFYTPTLNERDAQADSDELVRLRGEGSPAGDRAGHLTTEQRLYKLIQSACFSRPHIIVWYYGEYNDFLYGRELPT